MSIEFPVKLLDPILTCFWAQIAEIPFPESSSNSVASGSWELIWRYKNWTIALDNGWVEEWATEIIIFFSC